MAGPTVARADVEVGADGSGLPRQIDRIAAQADRQLSRNMNRTGRNSGNEFSSGFGDTVTDNLRSRISKRIDKQLLDAFDGSGRDSGRAFSSGFGGSVFAGMDRTVALVIKLIASIGPQMAALGSALSANVVAILSSSLMGLVGAMIALAPVAIAAAGGTALLITAFKDMKKTVPGLQKSLDGLSAAWKKQADAVGKQVGPALRDLNNDLAKAMNSSGFGAAIGSSMAQITKAFQDVVNSAGFRSFISEMTEVIPSALTGFGTGIAKLTEALLTMFGQVGPLAANLGSDFAAWATSVADASNRAAESGGFTKFFNDAYNSFQLLMGVLGPFTQAMGNVFAAGQPSGDRLLGTLGELAQKFLDWTKSIEGKNSLAEWFAQGEGIFDRLLGVIGSVGTTLADMVTPTTIGQVEDFLDSLKEIIPLVGDLLSTIGSADALNVFAQAILGILTAINPLLPALTELVSLIAKLPPEVIQTLAVAFTVFFAAFKVQALIGAISSMKLLATLILELRTAPTIIAGVRGAWAALSATFAISPIGLIITAVAALVAGLIYFFTQTEAGKKAWAAIWSGIQAAVQAVVAWFTGTFVPTMTAIWDAIVGGVKAVGDWFGRVWQAILDAPQNVVNWFTGTFVPFMQSLPGMLLDALIAYVQFWISLPGRIIGALANLLAFLIEWGANVAVSLIGWVSDTIPKVVQFFKDLPGNIIEAVSNFASDLGQWFTDAWNFMVDLVVSAVTAYINFWLELPGRIINAITSLGSMLGTFFTGVWNSLKTNVSEGIESILKFFRELPGKIVTALGNLLGTIGRIFTDAMGEGNRAALDGIANLLKTVGEIPAKILRAVGDLGSTLYNAGKDLIEGLIRGISSMSGEIAKKIKEVANKAVDTFKSWFGIKSPSTVMRGIGKNLMLGLQGGIASNADRPLRAMNSLAEGLVSSIGPVGTNFGTPTFSAANGNPSMGRTVNVASGAVVVQVPTSDPEQAANAVLDRLVARWK